MTEQPPTEFAKRVFPTKIRVGKCAIDCATVEETDEMQLRLNAAAAALTAPLLERIAAAERERDEAIKAAGAPTWQCRNCGGLGPFTTVTNGAPFDPPDYDLECQECQSTEVAESPKEAFNSQSDRADAAEALVAELANVSRLAQDFLNRMLRCLTAEDITQDDEEARDAAEAAARAAFDALSPEAKKLLEKK